MFDVVEASIAGSITGNGVLVLGADDLELIVSAVLLVVYALDSSVPARA